MSCIERYTGKLIPLNLTLITFMRNNLDQKRYDQLDESDYLEEFYDEFSGDYYYSQKEDKVYILEKIKLDPDDFFSTAVRQGNNILFTAMFHNGTTPLCDALDEAMEGLLKKEASSCDWL